MDKDEFTYLVTNQNGNIEGYRSQVERGKGER